MKRLDCSGLSRGLLGLCRVRRNLIEMVLAIHLVLIGSALAAADPLRSISGDLDNCNWWPNILRGRCYFCLDKMSHDINDIKTIPGSPRQFIIYSFVAPKRKNSNIWELSAWRIGSVDAQRNEAIRRIRFSDKASHVKNWNIVLKTHKHYLKNRFPLIELNEPIGRTPAFGGIRYISQWWQNNSFKNCYSSSHVASNTHATRDDLVNTEISSGDQQDSRLSPNDIWGDTNLTKPRAVGIISGMEFAVGP
jgi:hypothetical protein